MKEVYRIWCEWDIGVADEVYSSYSVAEKNAIRGLEDSGIEKSFDELEEAGYIGIDAITIIKK